jgi:hypothetical protein
MDDSQYQVFLEYPLRLCCINSLATTDRPLRANYQHERAAWKRAADYHGRSFAETAILLGQDTVGSLCALLFESQATETLLCLALNRMAEFGMPDS